jgi:uncharacterized phage protein gp47/JayE
MTATLDDLISPETSDEVLQYFLTELANVGFPTTAWQTGGVAYTLLRIESLKLSDQVALIAAIAKGGLLDLSSGAWLTLLAKSHYDLTRYPAAFAQGTVRVAIASGNPGQTIQPGQLWIKTPSGLLYNSVNPAPVVIGAGSSAVIQFKAESPGSTYNVAIGTGLTLVTPLPGMTATFEDTGDGTWLTVQGADEESDTNLKTRCRTRWATVGVQKTRDAYLFLTMNVPGLSTQPDRVYIDDQNPRGPGTVDVWFAGPGGPLPAPDATAIATYLTDRQSPCTDVDGANAVTRAITVTATYEYEGAFAGAGAQASDAVTAFIQALPLGGTLDRADIVYLIRNTPGVGDVYLDTVLINGSAADLTIAKNEVATVAAVTLTGVLVNP